VTTTASGTTTSAGGVEQVFTLYATIDYTNPSGASQMADSLVILRRNHFSSSSTASGPT